MPTKVFDGGLQGVEIAVGIDQSLTGFALTAISVHHPDKYHTWVYTSPYHGVERLVDIRQFLIDHFDYLEEQGHRIIDIAMEGAVLTTYAAIVMGELSALVRLTIYDYFDDERRYPIKIPPTTLKKFVTGKGTSKKAEMLLHVFKRWGVEFSSDDAADSYGLARMAAKVFISPLEKELIEKFTRLDYRDAPRLE